MTVLLNEINLENKWDISGFSHIALEAPLSCLQRNHKWQRAPRVQGFGLLIYKIEDFLKF